MTVGELLARMSSREFAEWQAWLVLEHEERLQEEARQRALAKLQSR
jgi:hypothetical protein